MKLSYSFTCAFLLSLNLLSGQSNQSLKGDIVQLLTEQNLSGAVWSVVHEDGSIATDAHGSKNLNTKQMLRASDKVQVGSVAKTLIAAAFLRMATLGLLHLDDPIKKYLPKLPVHNRFHPIHPITIRHLIDHTSGLTDAKLWHIFSTTANPDTPLEVAYLNSPGILNVHSKPGSIYSYSNLGYTLLGMIIEKISKKRYEDYLDEYLLKPLEMMNSSFHFVTQEKDKDLVFGHFDNGRPVTALPMYLRPAGQFTTNAEDIGKFLRFMMSDGTLNGQTFIGTQYLKAVGKQEGTDAFRKGVPFGDAFGAYSRDRYGVVGIAKNGNTLGFSAMMYMFPDQKKAFFISFNMDSETANYDLFNKVLVLHLHLKTAPPLLQEKHIDKDIDKWEGYYIPVITRVEPFGLADIVFSHTKVTLSQTTAMLSPFQGRPKILTYQGSNRFSMKNRTHVSHVFYISENGDFLISDGVKTFIKIKGLHLLGTAASLLSGIIAVIYLFMAGCVGAIREGPGFRHQAEFWVFTALLLSVFAIIALATQPFMHLGNFNVASVLLLLASLLLPAFSVVSLVVTIKKEQRYLRTCSFWALILLIQFCCLLIAGNLIPLMIWK